MSINWWINNSDTKSSWIDESNKVIVLNEWKDYQVKEIKDNVGELKNNVSDSVEITLSPAEYLKTEIDKYFKNAENMEELASNFYAAVIWLISSWVLCFAYTWYSEHLHWHEVSINSLLTILKNNPRYILLPDAYWMLYIFSPKKIWLQHKTVSTISFGWFALINWLLLWTFFGEIAATSYLMAATWWTITLGTNLFIWNKVKNLDALPWWEKNAQKYIAKKSEEDYQKFIQETEFYRANQELLKPQIWLGKVLVNYAKQVTGILNKKESK